jgi:hypothetical protein
MDMLIHHSHVAYKVAASRNGLIPYQNDNGDGKLVLHWENLLCATQLEVHADHEGPQNE